MLHAHISLKEKNKFNDMNLIFEFQNVKYRYAWYFVTLKFGYCNPHERMNVRNCEKL